MGRKTNKDFQEERRKLFHVRKVSKPDDLLDKKAKEEYVVGILFPTKTQTTIKYVTSVQTEPKVAKWDDGKEAMTFSKDYAKDLAFGLCINGYAAIVMIKPDYLTLVNPESNE